MVHTRRRRFLSYETPPSTPPARLPLLPVNVVKDWSWTPPPLPTTTSFLPPVAQDTIITINKPLPVKRKRKPSQSHPTRVAFNLFKLFLLLFIFLYNLSPSSSRPVPFISKAKRSLSEPFTIEAQVKSMVAAMLQGTHYGHMESEESLASFQNRMTFYVNSMLLCIPKHFYELREVEETGCTPRLCLQVSSLVRLLQTTAAATTTTTATAPVSCPTERNVMSAPDVASSFLISGMKKLGSSIDDSIVWTDIFNPKILFFVFVTGPVWIVGHLMDRALSQCVKQRLPDNLEIHGLWVFISQFIPTITYCLIFLCNMQSFKHLFDLDVTLEKLKIPHQVQPIIRHINPKSQQEFDKTIHQLNLLVTDLAMSRLDAHSTTIYDLCSPTRPQTQTRFILTPNHNSTFILPSHNKPSFHSSSKVFSNLFKSNHNSNSNSNNNNNNNSNLSSHEMTVMQKESE